MERGIIIISENGKVSMPNQEVWMTLDEIADMLGVFDSLVRKTIHAIYKSRELSETQTSICMPTDKGYNVEVYNLDMVIILAYRIRTVQGRDFVG